MISGTNGISRLELKTKTLDGLNPVTKAKSTATHNTNGALSESFKYESVKLTNQPQQKAYGREENGYRRINMFPWGGDKFSVTKSRHSHSRISYNAAVNTQHRVPN